MSASASFPTLPVRLVRGWVRLYTAGLPADLRDARREEIDADLWEQARDAALMARPTNTLRSQIALRLVLGVPADLLWRFDKATNRSSTEGRPTMETFAMRSPLGRATLAVMALLVVATIAVVVVHQIDRNGSTEIISRGLLNVLYTASVAVGLVLTASGLGLIRRAPWLGAVLAVGGSWVPALMLFWLVLPLFIAAGVSVFAILSAKKQANVG